jgi:hypothetical protein
MKHDVRNGVVIKLTEVLIAHELEAPTADSSRSLKRKITFVPEVQLE